ncbi:hypothetical protein MKC73_04140 [[Clostridium] innocuum]|nr:hypothetical protein [[Clostridium] innocuum]
MDGLEDVLNKLQVPMTICSASIKELISLFHPFTSTAGLIQMPLFMMMVPTLIRFPCSMTVQRLLVFRLKIV